MKIRVLILGIMPATNIRKTSGLITCICLVLGGQCLLVGCANQEKTRTEKPDSKVKIQKTTLSAPLVLKNIGYNTKTGIISMPEEIRAVAFSPDSRYVACVSGIEVPKGGTDTSPSIVTRDRTDDEISSNIFACHFVVIFEIATGVSKLQFITEAVVRSLAFSADSRTLFVGCDAHTLEDLGTYGTGYLQVWDIEHGKLLRNVEKDVNMMTVARAGHRLALGMGGGQGNRSTLAILDTTNWQTLHQFKPDVEVGILEDIAFSADGRWFGALFFARESSIGELWIWDTHTGKNLLHEVDGYETFSHPESSKAIEPPLAMTVPANKESHSYIYCGNTRFRVKYAGEQLKVLDKTFTIRRDSETLFAFEHFNPKRVVSADSFGNRVEEPPTTYSLWDLPLQKVVASWEFDTMLPQVIFSFDRKLLAVISRGNKCHILKLL